MFGTVVYNSTTYGSRANFSCDVGYDLVGSQRECEDGGKWSGKPTTCLPNVGKANYN